MGPCNSSHNTKKPSYNKTITSNGDVTHGDSTFHKDITPLKRISNRTKYADIKNFFTINQEKILGKGATGIVREAIENATKKKVAVKTVYKADVDTEKTECFKREINITLDLNNENVVKCLEIFEDHSYIHIVLELIQGGDLFDHIVHSPDRKLPEEEALDILSQILEALKYLHFELRVAHRDIKPENFLMYNDNGRNRVKLIDFGFATYIPKNDLMHEKLGTYLYIAPEMYTDEFYTCNVDLWATGVVLFNMVNGTQPFKNNSTLQEQVTTSEVNFAGFKNDKLKYLCSQLLKKNPKERFNAVNALSEVSLIKSSEASQSTVPANFKPNIQTIISMLCNDKAMVDEIRNLFLAHLKEEDLIQLKEDIKNLQSEEITGCGMLDGKVYIVAETLINGIMNQKYIPAEMLASLNELRKSKGELKLKRQMINLDSLFYAAIEGKRFIRKERIWHEFKTHDVKSCGYLTYDQLMHIFPDATKRQNFKIKIGEAADFEKFFQLWNEYEGINAK